MPALTLSAKASGLDWLSTPAGRAPNFGLLMTVAELIELLKTYPPDMEVWLDGGDWAGEVNSACVEDFSLGKHLLLSNDEE